MMPNLEEVIGLIKAKFGEESIIHTDLTTKQPVTLQVQSAQIAQICQELYENEQIYCDYLACLTALDNGPETGTMEIIYNLYSIPYNFQLMLKIVVPRNQDHEPLPEVHSVSHIWQTANWHEREAFDLLGIRFMDHPDLRRILLPADWQGHPLRKDYLLQKSYHGIKVEY